jgi:hypothetical protein
MCTPAGLASLRLTAQEVPKLPDFLTAPRAVVITRDRARFMFLGC